MSNLAETYIPFDTGPGATATPARWRSMSRSFQYNGVLPGFGSQFAASISLGNLTMGPGAVWVDGFYAETTVNHSVNSTGLGPGLVVLRADTVARTIGFYYLPGVSVPNQPVPSQATTIYEIPLYYITGQTTYNDVRQFATATTDFTRWGQGWSGGARNSNYCARGRMHRVGAYATSTTVYQYGFDTVTYGGEFFSGYSFICPYADDYLVCSSVGFVANAAGQWYHHWMEQNGNVATFHEVDSPGALYTISQLSDILPCKAGDAITIAHQCSVTGLQGLVGAANAYMAVRSLSR